MENISNTDFDRLEKLLRYKQLDELSTSEKQWVLGLISQEEYGQMATLYQSTNHLTDKQEIEPKQKTKTELDKVLAAKRQMRTVFQLKIPVYQSVAAALVFFFIGFGINRSRPVQTRIVHNTTQVIKYVDRPVKQIEYVTIYAKDKKKNVVLTKSLKTAPTVEILGGNDVTIPESNPEVLHQQEIALTNINRVLNEKNGSSMGGDTVLQKMMVTVY